MCNKRPFRTLLLGGVAALWCGAAIAGNPPVSPATFTTSGTVPSLGGLGGAPYLSKAQRAPSAADDAGYPVGQLWAAPSALFQKTNSSPGRWTSLGASAPLPGDAVSANGAPLACYGTRSMNAAYGASPAIDVQLTSGGTTTTINFLSDGTIDRGRLFALLATNGGVGRVVQAYDTTGNARHTGTIPFANAPAITMFSDIGGTPSIVFDTDIDSGSVVPRYLTIPAAVTANSRAFAWFAVVRMASAARNLGVLALIDTTASQYPMEFGFSASAGPSTPGYFYNFGGVSTVGGVGSITPQVIGASIGPSGDTFVYGASLAVTGTTPSQTLAGGKIGQTAGVLGYGKMELTGICLYGRALTAADQAAEQASFVSTFRTVPQALAVVDKDGDSITQGWQATFNRSASRRFADMLMLPAVVYNSGWWGQYLSQRIAALPLTLSAYNAAAPVNIFIEAAGINDILQNATTGATAASIQAMDQQFCAAVHAKGTNAKAVIETLLPSTALTTAQNTIRLAVNVNRVANAGACAFDRVIDLASDTLVGGTPTQPGTYYADQTHPDDAGYQLIAQIEADVVNAMLLP